MPSPLSIFFAICAALATNHELFAQDAHSPFQFVPAGEKISRDIAGYRKKAIEPLDDRFAVFVNYDEHFRPLGLDLETGHVEALGDIEGVIAVRATARFSPKAKSNVAVYRGNLRLLVHAPVTGFCVFLLEGGRMRSGGTVTPDEQGWTDLGRAIDLSEDGRPGATVQHSVVILAPKAEASRIERLLIHPEITFTDLPVKYPVKDTDLDEQIAPSAHENNYGSRPAFVPLANADGTLTLGWEERGGEAVNLTEFDGAFHVRKNLRIRKALPIFGGFTKNERGTYFVAFGKDNNDGDFSSNVVLLKLHEDGQLISKFQMNTAKQTGFDIMKPFSAAGGRVTYGGGSVALHFGKTQHRNQGDGLNHQSGVLAVVDTSTMQLDELRARKSTASHSFDQRTLYDGLGFVTLDLADNYPRGFNLGKEGTGRVVFTYKTHHGEGTKGGLPAGKWSNDNRTYSELGGVVPSKQGFIVLGSSERSLKNELAKGNLNEARNLFMVQVARDFNLSPPVQAAGKKQTNMVSDQVVVSKGEITGSTGFYDIGGHWNAQRRVGVVWLTDFKDKELENVVRPKLARLSENVFVALWERWTSKNYTTTQYLLFNAEGKKLRDVTNLGPVRLSRGDDVVVAGGKIVWGTGSRSRSTLRIYAFAPVLPTIAPLNVTVPAGDDKIKPAPSKSEQK